MNTKEFFDKVDLVMAGLVVPAIHAFEGGKDVDARLGRA
jgi:hypothetical protein